MFNRLWSQFFSSESSDESTTSTKNSKPDDKTSGSETEMTETSNEIDIQLMPTGLKKLLDKVDLSHPPGLAGDICEDLATLEYRALPNLRPAAAMMILSSLASQIENPPYKLNLYVISTALTASGKEAHQNYLKQALSDLGLDSKLHDTPRSDKTIMFDLLYSEGCSIYVLDEGHVLFRTALSSRASTFEKNMADLLLQLKTAKQYRLSGNLKREVQEQLIARLEKADKKKSNTAFQPEDKEKLKNLLELTNECIHDPFVNLISYSVPQNVAFLFSKKEIETGLLGRIIFVRGPSKRAPLRGHDKVVRPSKDISERLKAISTENLPTESLAARTTLHAIKEYLERDENRNHGMYGAIFARGYEQIRVVAALLALESKKIDQSMVIYAFKQFLNSLHECETHLSKQSKTSIEESQKLVELKVREYSERHGSGSFGVIRNNIFKCSAPIRKLENNQKDFLSNTLQKFADMGVLIKVGNNQYLHKSCISAKK